MRKLISLYTGAGGLDLGFEAAGFETAVAVEIDPEAVETLRHNRDWPVLDTNYDLAVARLNAADYGVPQLRERVFVIGAREGTGFSFPTPTHISPNGGQLPLGMKPHATTWDAIGDLENDSDLSLRTRGRWGDLLPSVPEGENYLWHTARGGANRSMHPSKKLLLVTRIEMRRLMFRLPSSLMVGRF